MNIKSITTKMRTVMLLFIIFQCYFLKAQDWDIERPDYQIIEKNIKKAGSNLFYDLLMAKFQMGDSTMTLEEKRHLYYGYTFHENYHPYSRSDYSDSLKGVMELEHHTIVEYQRIINFSDSALYFNPFDLRAINSQLYALEKLGKKIEFDIKLNQLKLIIDALVSSGYGTNKEEAFFVIYTTHEYDLLEFLGFKYGGSQSLKDGYDYLTVGENDAGVEGLYFDVSPCLLALNKMFKE